MAKPKSTHSHHTDKDYDIMMKESKEPEKLSLNNFDKNVLTILIMFLKSVKKTEVI